MKEKSLVSQIILKMLFTCLICLFVYCMSSLTVQAKKPTSKRQLSVWQLECELGTISDPECPVDGGWSPWSPWSPCQGPCDDVGHRRRFRECTNPQPSRDGAACSGTDEQTEICFLTNCTVDDFRNLVNGDSARMKALKHLEAVPALMERCLQMDCPYEAIEAALTFDNTWQLNYDFLWNALQCVKRNLGCPKAGEWGAWGVWSACGARCGRGLKWRLRRCDTPPPSDANLVCAGTPLQANDCTGDQCAISSLESGGSWGSWSSWTTCSEKCGPGVRRRKRFCHETYQPQASGTGETHCRGQHDQLEVCENPVCNLDGGWSGWSGWGPCSEDCGAGKRSRTRSCTRPIPSGTGKPCVGPRTEVDSCHITPCEGYSHQVALFNGESFFHYDFSNKRAALFHFYIRFMPLSHHGTLIRRSTGVGAYVRLSLQKWHLCLEACGSGRFCCLLRTCSHFNIKPAVWHNVLITVTNKDATLRIDDSHTALKSAWLCQPELPDDNLNIYIGEKFQGQIQELILNFIPLKIILGPNRDTIMKNVYPVTASNIAYEKSSTTEAYLHIKHDHYLRLSCFENQNEWKLELTVKPKREAGTLLFMMNEEGDNWLHLDLQNNRLKMKLALGAIRSESCSTTEATPDKWLDVEVMKKHGTNAIEATINAGERLHVLYEEETVRPQRQNVVSWNNLSKKDPFALCTDEFFIGGVPNEIKERFMSQEYISLSGVLASVRINKDLVDLHAFSLERYKDNKVQVSSRTASVSGSYHETAWGKSNRLNLTCIHTRTATLAHEASWIFLDTQYIVANDMIDKKIRSINDGRVLRLVASADNDLRGFYTCRSHSNRRTVNIVTYGVLGQVQYNLHGPDTITAIATFTTAALVLMTLVWLFIEGIYDLRNGYGFFRDAHLSPEEEAEAICKYIDQNANFLSPSAVSTAKARAKRRGRRLAASRVNFGAQVPQSSKKENLQSTDQVKLQSLPEVSSGEEITHDIYKVEPCYISSPRHGTLTSPRTRVTSSSSFDLVSPTVLCSKLLVSKGSTSSGSVYPKSLAKLRRSLKKQNQSRLVTIKSSSLVNLTPAQKILQKFKELQRHDF